MLKRELEELQGLKMRADGRSDRRYETQAELEQQSLIRCH